VDEEGEKFLACGTFEEVVEGRREGGRGGGRDVHVCSRAVSVWRKEEEKRTC